MAYYYVNKNAQDNNDHEVHNGGCSWLPKVENRIYLERKLHHLWAGDHRGEKALQSGQRVRPLFVALPHGLAPILFI